MDNHLLCGYPRFFNKFFKIVNFCSSNIWIYSLIFFIIGAISSEVIFIDRYKKNILTCMLKYISNSVSFSRQIFSYGTNNLSDTLLWKSSSAFLPSSSSMACVVGRSCDSLFVIDDSCVYLFASEMGRT